MTEQPTTPTTDDTDNDTEGHAFYSDRDLKDDIADAPADAPDNDTDDTEGHGARFSGALPQEPTENDTEGHVQPPRGDDTDHPHS
jgi:hypothetical protein